MRWMMILRATLLRFTSGSFTRSRAYLFRDRQARISVRVMDDARIGPRAQLGGTQEFRWGFIDYGVTGRSFTRGEASGTDASKRRKLRTRFDSSISRRDWHEFYADTRKERMATSSRRERDGFLTSATHSRRCTGQGIEVDSTPFGAFALRSFAGEGCRRT